MHYDELRKPLIIAKQSSTATDTIPEDKEEEEEELSVHAHT
jgi:hypothetical protein